MKKLIVSLVVLAIGFMMLREHRICSERKANDQKIAESVAEFWRSSRLIENNLMEVLALQNKLNDLIKAKEGSQ